jgi:uncharacterized protein YndB with AHSA1/START domain
MENTRITIACEIANSPEAIWTYYTQPEHITNWNFASDDWHCPAAHNDLKVGGLYRVRMEAKDGSFGFDLEATYQSIVLGHSFTYIMSDQREVSFRLTQRDTLTHVEITFEAENMNPIEMQREGWQSILNNFKKYAEQASH